MADATQNSMDTLLGRLVVERGLASPDDVEACFELQRRSSEESDPSGRTLGQVMIENGIVTQRQLERIRPEVEEQRSSQQIPGYKILKKLGSGAMATVYLAKQISLDRQVAIKVLPKKYTDNDQFVERFYAEGKAAAQLNHANIVQAYDVGKAGDYHYFVMEFVEGHTVYDDIMKHQRYTEDEALRIAIQVSRALEHAHKAGFIHRDVKPKNIMITEDGTAKLADMGLARAVSDREAAESEQGKAFGTPYYISPEQIRGERDVDFRADIYSLGATFYHMVTGRVPFEGPNPSAVMHMHLKQELVPPDHINPNLSAGISEIIELCMAKDREKRYSSASDLIADLEAVAAGEPPLQARKQFDLSALSAIEGESEVEVPTIADDRPGPVVVDGGAEDEPLTAQPLFWAAAGGWGVALLLLAALIIILLAG